MMSNPSQEPIDLDNLRMVTTYRASDSKLTLLQDTGVQDNDYVVLELSSFLRSQMGDALPVPVLTIVDIPMALTLEQADDLAEVLTKAADRLRRRLGGADPQ